MLWSADTLPLNALALQLGKDLDPNQAGLAFWPLLA
jgi:hypothetical protein